MKSKYIKETTRLISVRMPEELLSSVGEYAKKHKLTRSVAIIVLLEEALMRRK